MPESRLETLDDVKLDHLNDPTRRKVREMLEPLPEMWVGHFGILKVTENRILINEGSTPVLSQPYSAGPEVWKVIEQSVAEMRQAGVIEPANSESASPVVLVPKPDGTPRFNVDDRKVTRSQHETPILFQG